MNQTRSLPLSKRGMSFETFMWAFTRLTALGMYFFMFIAVTGAIVMGAANDMTFVEVVRWALVSNPGHVEYTNVPDIAPWASAFWRTVASGMFLTALAHGIHGVIVIFDDYIPTVAGRNWNRYLNMALFFVVMGAGLYLIWTA
jgi:succinate dehydrogenase hydrophobic anchor subunit